MPQLSPYTPGEVARTVPGRSSQLKFYERRAQEVCALGRFISRPRVDHAARGVGKTSLLREAQRIFERHGAATLWVTANEDEKLLPVILSGLRMLLPTGQRLAEDLVALVDNATVTLGAGAAKASVTLKPNPTAIASAGQTFAKLLKSVASALDARAKGVVILIDEVQSADKPSLRALSHGWQELGSDDDAPPAALFFVGLPGSVDHLTSAVTFSERFEFEPLFGIDEAGATEALVAPAQALGVTWSPDAVRAAVNGSEGYPFKVQLMGEASWISAGEPDPGATITEAHVDAAIPIVESKMRVVFASRWRSASTRQRELMVAIAELGGVKVKRDDIVKRLGVATTAISVPRDKLLQKGLIDATGHGLLSFTLPGFKDYVLEQV